MNERTTGLTLGKFAPLHRGHQWMIESALSEVDELIVVIYDCPETTAIPLPIRAQWIRSIYPQVTVYEAWDGPTDYGDTPEIKQRQEAYILRVLNGKKITHFYSSEFYGEHMSAALHAVDRRVDPERRKVPISGTAVRANPFAGRAFVHPLVYRDLVSNVVLLGAPSTGKTTLASRLANYFGTQWMPEYGREYWEKHQVDRRLTPEQLIEIAEGHLEKEEKLLQESNRYLFVDTNAITTYQFSLYYHDHALPQLQELARQAETRYDLVFVCDDDIPYDDTWDRSGETNRTVFQKQQIAYLHIRKIPYILLSGTLEERVNKVESVLARYRKYMNRGSLIDMG